MFEEENLGVENAVNDEAIYVPKENPDPCVLDEHFKSHCMLCGAGYLSESELEFHIEEVHEIKCNKCSEIFYDKYDLDTHKTTHTSLPQSQDSTIPLEELAIQSQNNMHKPFNSLDNLQMVENRFFF